MATISPPFSARFTKAKITPTCATVLLKTDPTVEEAQRVGMAAKCSRFRSALSFPCASGDKVARWEGLWPPESMMWTMISMWGRGWGVGVAG